MSTRDSKHFRKKSHLLQIWNGSVYIIYCMCMYINQLGNSVKIYINMKTTQRNKHLNASIHILLLKYQTESSSYYGVLNHKSSVILINIFQSVMRLTNGQHQYQDRHSTYLWWVWWCRWEDYGWKNSSEETSFLYIVSSIQFIKCWFWICRSEFPQKSKHQLEALSNNHKQRCIPHSTMTIMHICFYFNKCLHFCRICSLPPRFFHQFMSWIFLSEYYTGCTCYL